MHEDRVFSFTEAIEDEAAIGSRRYSVVLASTPGPEPRLGDGLMIECVYGTGDDRALLEEYHEWFLGRIVELERSVVLKPRCLGLEIEVPERGLVEDIYAARALLGRAKTFVNTESREMVGKPGCPRGSFDLDSAVLYWFAEGPQHLDFQVLPRLHQQVAKVLEVLRRWLIEAQVQRVVRARGLVDFKLQSQVPRNTCECKNAVVSGHKLTWWHGVGWFVIAMR
jgi:hypothetical protein